MTQATSSKSVTTDVTTSAEPTPTMTQATSSKSVKLMLQQVLNQQRQ